VLANIRDAIQMHLQGMIEDHEPIPAPTSEAGYIEVHAATA
jgi:predicted RNase H-like HicB family nuclease